MLCHRAAVACALAFTVGVVVTGCDDDQPDVGATMLDDARTIVSVDVPAGWQPDDVGPEGSTRWEVGDTLVAFVPEQGESVVAGWVSPASDDIDGLCRQLIDHLDDVTTAIDPDEPFADLPTTTTCPRLVEAARAKSGPMLAGLSRARVGARAWFIGTTVFAPDDGTASIIVNVTATSPPPE